MWHGDSLIATCRIQFPDVPCNWDHGVLATVPPGQSHKNSFIELYIAYFEIHSFQAYNSIIFSNFLYCAVFSINQFDNIFIPSVRFFLVIYVNPHSHLCVCACACAKLLQSCLTLCDPILAHQAPLFVGFCRQEYWSGLLCLFQGIFLTQGSNFRLLRLLHCRWTVCCRASREAHSHP